MVSSDREHCKGVPVGAAGGAEVIDAVLARLTAVARARTLLAEARVELDSAVSSLSSGVKEVMASSAVVDLLIRVVAARRHLEDLERVASGAEPGSRA